jgi:hypothetical protein
MDMISHEREIRTCFRWAKEHGKEMHVRVMKAKVRIWKSEGTDMEKLFSLIHCISTLYWIGTLAMHGACMSIQFVACMTKVSEKMYHHHLLHLYLLSELHITRYIHGLSLTTAHHSKHHL